MKKLILRWQNYTLTKKSLLFVESPLQLLNAHEAISEFNLKNYEVVIRLSNKKENDSQIKYLVDYLNIQNIKYVLIKVDDKGLTDYIKLLMYKYKYLIKKVKKVFIGNYDSGFFKLIMKQFTREQIILLDDGSKTLAIQKQFSENNFYNLFTIYNVETINNQLIYNNRYNKITTILKNLKFNNDEILFLGMKLSEIGIITEKEYIRLLVEIADIYKHYTIIYVTHRGESKSKIEKIKEIRNISIQNYSYPIELLGIFEKSIPNKVISFYSTAVLTIKYIYNIEAECFSFDFSTSKHKDAIESVYDYYKKEMKVINLND